MKRTMSPQEQKKQRPIPAPPPESFARVEGNATSNQKGENFLYSFSLSPENTPSPIPSTMNTSAMMTKKVKMHEKMAPSSSMIPSPSSDVVDMGVSGSGVLRSRSSREGGSLRPGEVSHPVLYRREGKKPVPSSYAGGSTKGIPNVKREPKGVALTTNTNAFATVVFGQEERLWDHPPASCKRCPAPHRARTVSTALSTTTTSTLSSPCLCPPYPSPMDSSVEGREEVEGATCPQHPTHASFSVEGSLEPTSLSSSGVLLSSASSGASPSKFRNPFLLQSLHVPTTTRGVSGTTAGLRRGRGVGGGRGKGSHGTTISSRNSFSPKEKKESVESVRHSSSFSPVFSSFSPSRSSSFREENSKDTSSGGGDTLWTRRTSDLRSTSKERITIQEEQRDKSKAEALFSCEEATREEERRQVGASFLHGSTPSTFATEDSPGTSVSPLSHLIHTHGEGRRMPLPKEQEAVRSPSFSFSFTASTNPLPPLPLPLASAQIHAVPGAVEVLGEDLAGKESPVLLKDARASVPSAFRPETPQFSTASTSFSFYPMPSSAGDAWKKDEEEMPGRGSGEAGGWATSIDRAQMPTSSSVDLFFLSSTSSTLNSPSASASGQIRRVPGRLTSVMDRGVAKRLLPRLLPSTSPQKRNTHSTVEKKKEEQRKEGEETDEEAERNGKEMNASIKMKKKDMSRSKRGSRAKETKKDDAIHEEIADVEEEEAMHGSEIPSGVAVGLPYHKSSVDVGKRIQRGRDQRGRLLPLHEKTCATPHPTLSSSSSTTSSLLVGPFQAENFIQAFQKAEGNTSLQHLLLQQLAHWLSKHPPTSSSSATLNGKMTSGEKMGMEEEVAKHHSSENAVGHGFTEWDTLQPFFMGIIRRVEAARVVYRTAMWEYYSVTSPASLMDSSSLPLPPSPEETEIALRLLALLLHYTPDPLQQPEVLVDMMVLLRGLTEEEGNDDDDEEDKEEEQQGEEEANEEQDGKGKEHTHGASTQGREKLRLRMRIKMKSLPKDSLALVPCPPPPYGGASEMNVSTKKKSVVSLSNASLSSHHSGTATSHGISDSTTRTVSRSGGVSQWLEKEILFDPLLAILSDPRALEQPELLCTILSVIQESTTHAVEHQAARPVVRRKHRKRSGIHHRPRSRESHRTPCGREGENEGTPASTSVHLVVVSKEEEEKRTRGGSTRGVVPSSVSSSRLPVPHRRQSSRHDPRCLRSPSTARKGVGTEKEPPANLQRSTSSLSYWSTKTVISTAAASSIPTQLVTLGVIPKITAVAQFILAKVEAEEEEKENKKRPHTDGGTQDGDTEKQSQAHEVGGHRGSTLRLPPSATSLPTATSPNPTTPSPTLHPFLSSSPATSPSLSTPLSLFSSVSSSSSLSTAEWWAEIITQVCLIYRNLSIDFAVVLHQFHVLDMLTLILYSFRHSHLVLETAARALAKLVFDPLCLASLAENTHFMRAALQAMMTQLHASPSSTLTATRSTKNVSSPFPYEEEDEEETEDTTTVPHRCHLLVARLAGAMARVAEQSEDQRDLLARHGTALLLLLIRRYVRLDLGPSLVLLLEAAENAKQGLGAPSGSFPSGLIQDASLAQQSSGSSPRGATEEEKIDERKGSNLASLSPPTTPPLLSGHGQGRLTGRVDKSQLSLHRSKQEQKEHEEGEDSLWMDPFERTVQSVAAATLAAGRSPTKKEAAVLLRPFTAPEKRGNTGNLGDKATMGQLNKKTTGRNEDWEEQVVGTKQERERQMKYLHEKEMKKRAPSVASSQETQASMKGKAEKGAFPLSSLSCTQNLPLIQAVVWLVGVAAMSPFCSHEIVLQGVPRMTRLLQDIAEVMSFPVCTTLSSSKAGAGEASTTTSDAEEKENERDGAEGKRRGFVWDAKKKAHFVALTRPTLLYTLMAISNLSFFFGSIQEQRAEDVKGGGEPVASLEEGDMNASRSSREEHLARREKGTRDQEETKKKKDTVARLVELYEPLALTTASILFSGDAEAAVEATRIISNICFTPAGADWVEEHRLDEVLVLFMGHEDRRIVYNCASALLNLTAGITCRIVEDPDLLSMLLSYTRHWTKSAEETKEESNNVIMDPKKVVLPISMEKSYRKQIADVVDRLLHNISGLLPLPQHEKEGEEVV